MTFVMCARFSLRYEQSHVLPWVRWHAHQGADHFYLYLDALSSNLSSEAQSRTYNSLLADPRVTMFNTSQLGIEKQGKALGHCVAQVSRSRALWGMDLDIDEVVVGGPTLGADCAGRSSFKGLLARFVSSLPAAALGVVVPRVSYGPNGHTVAPAAATQMQAYTLRQRIGAGGGAGGAGSSGNWTLGAGKVIFRGGASPRSVVVASKHALATAAGGVVMYPDLRAGVPVGCNGTAPAPSRVREGDSAGGGSAGPLSGSPAAQPWCTVDIKGYDMPTALRHLRLHHYATRSTAECTLKMRDVAAPWHHRQGMSTWRAERFAPHDHAAHDDGRTNGENRVSSGAHGPSPPIAPLASAVCAVRALSQPVHDFTAACHTRGYVRKLEASTQAQKRESETGPRRGRGGSLGSPAGEGRHRLKPGPPSARARAPDGVPKSSAMVPGPRVMCNAFEELENRSHVITMFAAHQQHEGAGRRSGGGAGVLVIMYQTDRRGSAGQPEPTAGAPPASVWCNGEPLVPSDPNNDSVHAARKHRRWVVTVRLEATESCASVGLHFAGSPSPLEASMCPQRARGSARVSAPMHGSHEDYSEDEGGRGRRAGAASTTPPVHTSACAPIFLSPHSAAVRAVTVEAALEWITHMLSQVGEVHLQACNRYDDIVAAAWRRFDLANRPRLRRRIVIRKWNWIERYAGRGVHLAQQAHELTAGGSSSNANANVNRSVGGINPYHIHEWVISKCVLETRGLTEWMMVMDIDERIGVAATASATPSTQPQRTPTGALDQFLRNEPVGVHLHKFCEFRAHDLRDSRRVKSAYRVSIACTFLVLPHAGVAVAAGPPGMRELSGGASNDAGQEQRVCNSDRDVPSFGACQDRQGAGLRVLHHRLNRRINRHMLCNKTGWCS